MKAKVLVISLAVVTLLVLPFENNLAGEPARSRQFNVPEHGLCLFGHWISGTVDVALAEEEVFINGIPLTPPDAAEVKEQEAAGPSTDRGRLTWEMYNLQESLAAENISPETITSKCLEFLEKSPLVEHVEHLQGVVYRIHWAQGGSTIVNIESLPVSNQEQVVRENRTEEFYDRLCAWLDKKKVVIFATGGLVVLPVRIRTDPAFLAEVNRAQDGSEKWDVNAWGEARFFPSIIAEEMRVPLDLSNPEVQR